jgi:hypothetical protein
MMIRRLAPLLLLAALPIQAADFSTIGTLSQDEFHRISQDLGAAFSYKGVTPATPLGIAGFDVSASLFGAELRYALMDDGIAAPALGVRLSGTRAGGLGDLKLNTAAVDLVVSKKITALTPYAGAGMVRVQSSVNGSGLAEERFNKGRVFGGVDINLLAVNLAFEAEKMGGNTSLTAKVGWRF